MAEDTGGEELRLLTEAGLARGTTVVDIGCGSGALSRLIARAVGPAGRVLGLDSSAFNVARSREIAAQEKLDNAIFEVADPGETRVAPGFADLCVAHYLLGRVLDPERVVKEMARVTRPGGVVAVFDTDEGLTVFEPEPPGVTKLRSLLARERLAAGGSLTVGRSLYRLLSEAGLSGVRVVLLTSNSTEPGWSATRDPASRVGVLARAVRSLTEEGKLNREESARYHRALDEVTKSQLGFICATDFFAHGRRPLRCA